MENLLGELGQQSVALYLRLSVLFATANEEGGPGR